ncbi:hypothetical protein M0D21_09250 [Aquimarina sp. D1M17]|uniref:triple tyrosine motif-containing protein n=1 Tax=Aquimarina acroporae TaxID=2937283 RepID=UPI0020C00E3B|nr:triple tyrosine motif-containing protein [Aquimarina acroporae]MCK8521756.1 hypothetical protein [Aquimarina acroporae]
MTEVTNYTNEDIGKAATKTYDIVQDDKERLYFANEYGLIEYTGNSWKVLLQPKNRSSINALLSFEDRIYIGGNNEIGYAAKNTFDQTYYTKIDHATSSNCKEFFLVWEIIEVQNTVYFFTNNQIISYKSAENKTQCIRNQNDIRFATKINGIIYFVDQTNTIFTLDENGIKTLFKPEIPENGGIKLILPHSKDSFLIFTTDNRIYKIKDDQLFSWGTFQNSEMFDSDISTAVLLNNGGYCIGTTNKGILFVDKEGNLLQQLDRNNELLSNTILDLYVDKSNNLWVALDGSISYIELKAPFYTISENEGVFGSTYAIKMLDDILYIGTSDGVYYSKWPLDDYNKKFNRLPGIEGQIWDLSVIDKKLFIGGHNGSFLVENDEIIPLSQINGGWNFVQFPENDKLILQGTYTGLVVYEKINEAWVYRNKIEGFEETAREVLIRDNEVWISHGYKGVYRLKLSTDYKNVIEQRLYDQKNGFPGNLFISLLDVDENELHFGTQLGAYSYSKALDSMIINRRFTNTLTNHNLIRKVTNLSDNKTLFIQGYDRDDDIGIIHYAPNGDETIQRIPFQRLKTKLIPAFEEVLIFDNNDIGFTSKKGVIIYTNNTNTPRNTPFNTLLKNVKIKDSIIYGNVKDYVINIRKDSTIDPIPFNLNKLSFQYSTPFFEQPESITYKTYLEGLDEDWSDWSKESQKEYNFLPAGSYTFRVKAKNIYDNIGNEAIFKFEIKPPWYKSLPMYAVYLILLILIIYLFIKVKNRQRRKSLENLKTAHRKEIELQQIKFEEKRLKAKNEKIKKDNKFLKENLEARNKELASSAMQMVQVDNQLLQLKKALDEIYQESDGVLRKKIRQSVKLLENQIKGDNNWKHFETHFNQIHDNSLERLREQYPDLNHREIRLCAYLKLNLSSKEIAPLMGISYRGIESLRFRVRKKMNLDTTVNLTDYIIRF